MCDATRGPPTWLLVPHGAIEGAGKKKETVIRPNEAGSIWAYQFMARRGPDRQGKTGGRGIVAWEKNLLSIW